MSIARNPHIHKHQTWYPKVIQISFYPFHISKTISYIKTYLKRLDKSINMIFQWGMTKNEMGPVVAQACVCVFGDNRYYYYELERH